MSVRAIRAGHAVRSALLRRRLAAEIARDRHRTAGLVVLGVVFGAVVFGIGYGGAWYATYQKAPELILTGTVAGLTGIAVALVFSSLGHAAQAFFSAKDLWLWDSAPAGPLPRFVDRFVETAIAALPPTLALGTLALCGLQAGSGGGVLGMLRATLAVWLIAPVPVAAGTALAHVGGAILPAGRLRRLSLVLLGLLLTGGLVWFRSMRVERLLTVEGAGELLAQAGSVQTFGPSWLPPQQLARFVVDGGVSALAVGVAGVFTAIAVAFVAHVALYTRARKLAVDESPTGVLPGGASATMLNVITSFASADLRPMLRKDLLAFVRDPGQWGQVILLIGVGVLYVVNAQAMGEGLRVLGRAGDAMLTGMHVGIVSFIAGGLAARFAFPQVGLEGPAVWITDGAPMAPHRLLRAKWLAALPVTAMFPIVLAIAGAVVLDFGARRLALTVMLLSITAVLFAGLGTARGARQPLYDAASLSELAMGPGAISTIVQATLFSFVNTIATVVIEAALGARFSDRALMIAVATVAFVAPIVIMWVTVRNAMRAANDAMLARRRDGGAPPSTRTADTVEMLA